VSVRLRSVLDLPPPMREQVQRQFAAARKAVTALGDELRLMRLREERERLVLAMLKQLEYLNLACLFEREYRFHPERLWRLDLFSQPYRLGIELHGGLHDGARGRHIRGKGFMGDREKMNAAAERGITVLEYWPQAIADGSAAAQVQRILEERT